MLKLDNSIASNEYVINKKEMKKVVRRNIVLLSMGQFVSLFGTSIYTFAISLFILVKKQDQV